jgi:hypothetical protein
MKEKSMKSVRKSVAVIGLAALATLTGCSSNKPEGYHKERPAVDELHSRDRGLQSSEVVEASDLLVQKILALPEVQQAPRRMTVVFDRLDDQTRSRQFNYDIFLERLKTNIAEQGRTQIAIVSNKQNYYGVRSREIDGAGGGVASRERDDAGHGNGRAAAPTNRVQADYALTGKVMELPNRGTNYYLFTFTLADIRADGGGTEIPMRYEVRVRK